MFWRLQKQPTKNTLLKSTVLVQTQNSRILASKISSLSSKALFSVLSLTLTLSAVFLNKTAQASSDKVQTMLSLVNQLRREHNLPPLYPNSALMQSAQWYAEYSASTGWLDHTEPNGRTFDKRIRDFGYDNFTTVGENLALGSADPQTIFNQWLNSSVHRRNMLASGYCEIGIGLANNGDLRYGNYWVQTFGCRANFQPPNNLDSSSFEQNNRETIGQQEQTENQKTSQVEVTAREIKGPNVNQSSDEQVTNQSKVEQANSKRESVEFESDKTDFNKNKDNLSRLPQEEKNNSLNSDKNNSSNSSANLQKEEAEGKQKYYATLVLKRDRITEQEGISVCLWTTKQRLLTEQVLDSSAVVDFTLSVPQVELLLRVVQAKPGSLCQKQKVLYEKKIDLYEDQETVLNLSSYEEDTYLYTTLRVVSAKGRLF